MDNVQVNTGDPGFFKKLADRAKEGLHALKDTYVIEISEIIVPPKGETIFIPEVKNKTFLILKEGDEIDFTDDHKKASRFKFLFGSMIVAKLRKALNEKGNTTMRVDMSALADVNFIETVMKGE